MDGIVFSCFYFLLFTRLGSPRGREGIVAMGVAQSCCAAPPPPNNEPIDPKAVADLNAALSEPEPEPEPAPAPPKPQPVDDGLAAEFVDKAIMEALKEAPADSSGPITIWEPVAPKKEASLSCFSCAGRKPTPKGIYLKKVFSAEKFSCLSRELKHGKEIYARVTHPTHQVSTQSAQTLLLRHASASPSLLVFTRSLRYLRRRSRQHQPG